jgi:D-beta-D-heptose 7-phosphate kinase/D-beta-D-heptose 1-phosphate adenosyltransferase
MKPDGMHRLASLLDGLGSPRVLVVGDLILDHYVEGGASRVSPEAPVLVFEKRSDRWLLGGACNVAANLAALGAQASVLGVIGEDVAGQRLRDLLDEQRIDAAPVILDTSRPTTLKTRYVSKTAQILRVDSEGRHALAGRAREDVLRFLAQRPFPFDAVLVSDYGKGMLDREIVAAAVAAAESVDGLVVVDPKGDDYTKYRGVDLLTPNREEAERATGVRIDGLESMQKAAARLRELTGIRSVTITLGKDGIFFEEPGQSPRVLPTEARAVFDVTGAGDTVVSVLTFCRAAGVELEDALRLANVAAGIVVGRFGTWAVRRSEILRMLGEQAPGKVLDLDGAVNVASRLRAEGRRLVFTNGCFDIIHPGHTDYLAKARAYGDCLMVAVNTDESVQRQNKGPGRPINPLADRMAVLAALQSVDYVVPFDDDTPLGLIEATTPQVLVKGEDWRDRGVVGREWVEDHGGQVVLVRLVEGRSTTAIVDRILATRAGDGPSERP